MFIGRNGVDDVIVEDVGDGQRRSLQSSKKAIEIPGTFTETMSVEIDGKRRNDQRVQGMNFEIDCGPIRFQDSESRSSPVHVIVESNPLHCLIVDDTWDENLDSVFAHQVDQRCCVWLGTEGDVATHSFESPDDVDGVTGHPSGRQFGIDRQAPTGTGLVAQLRFRHPPIVAPIGASCVPGCQ